MTVAPERITDSQVDWADANRLFLEVGLRRIRLLLALRIRWLRARWAGFAAVGLEADVEAAELRDRQVDRVLAGEERDAFLRFLHADPEGRRIQGEIDFLREETNRLRAELANRGWAPALDQLIERLGLSELDGDVLLLALSRHLDPALGQVMAYVQDDLTRPCPTAHLALQLLAPDDPDPLAAAHSFESHAPLLRYRLIEPAGDGPVTDGFRIGLRAAGFIQGFNSTDPRLARCIEDAMRLPLTAAQEELVRKVVQWAGSALVGGTWPRLNLVGPRGHGAEAAAAKICDDLGLGLMRIDLETLVALDADPISLLERETALLGSAIYLELEPAELADTRPPLTAHFERLLVGLRALVFVGSETLFETRLPLLYLPLPRPQRRDQPELWRRALGQAELADGELLPLVEQFDLGPGEIARLATLTRARTRVEEGGERAVGSAQLWETCRETLRRGMDGLAQRISSAFERSDLVLGTDAHHLLDEIRDQVRHRKRVYSEWGFGRKLSRGRGITALFSGPSGTGKTMAAEALASELDLDAYRVDLSSVVSKYIGETEKNLRRVFDAAERAGVVLFFDEADALFGKRSEVKDSHDRYANIAIDYLLQRMEEYSGLAILATNLRSHLDQAFLRRLRFVVEFAFPDADRRREIWRRCLPLEAPLGDIDFDQLCRLKIAGGNIRNITLNAAFLAAAEGTPLGMSQLMRAAANEYTKEERLVSAAEFGRHLELARTKSASTTEARGTG